MFSLMLRFNRVRDMCS